VRERERERERERDEGKPLLQLHRKERRKEGTSGSGKVGE
jgi:hypothetical protein